MRDTAERLARHTGVKESHQILVSFMVEIQRRHDAIPMSIFGGPKPAHRELAAIHSALAELGALLTAHATEIFDGTTHSPQAISETSK
ncbi:hypothetical protein LH464_05415 [Neorhizobium sp. T786]|uniref:hypothetical protein n=1 Tax=Pseudorhizobium xiangyangii TaxID=2883104 RepID=UPI001CFFB6D3|nr:hypothetical protein [Neorhizobium xiangyangii]MCB5201917.1 hypothetical protein [Neorhizobium xiangyangii]